MMEVENRRQDGQIEERWEDVWGNEGSDNTCDLPHKAEKLLSAASSFKVAMSCIQNVEITTFILFC